MEIVTLIVYSPVPSHLSELKEELEDGSFLRCHRSCLVNPDYVPSIEQGDFAMKNGDRVPISVQRAEDVKRSFFDWSLEKSWAGSRWQVSW